MFFYHDPKETCVTEKKETVFWIVIQEFFFKFFRGKKCKDNLEEELSYDLTSALWAHPGV